MIGWHRRVFGKFLFISNLQCSMIMEKIKCLIGKNYDVSCVLWEHLLL